MAANKGKNKLPIILSVGLLVFIAGFWAYINYVRGPEVDPSKVKMRPNVRMENTATTTDSPAYYDANREHDQKRAAEARETGQSALAKPMGQSRPLDDLERGRSGLTAEQVMEMIRRHGAEMEARMNARMDTLARQRAPQQQRQSPFRDSISGFLQRTVAEHNNLQPGQIVMSNLPEEAETIPAKTTAAVSDTQDTATGSTASKAPIDAGEMLYAVLDVGANSDQPGTPVMARVVMGPWVGAKFIGGFTTGNEKLVLQFNRMVYNGRTYTVSGYAVDPQTLTPGVSSNVDSHFLERWGGLIAASFLEGFGRAVERSGTTYNYGSYGGNDTVAVPEYKLHDELWIAAGEVGKKASNIFANNFNRPPTVSLDPGTQVGILIL